MLYSMKIFLTDWLWKLYYLACTLSRLPSKKYCCSEIMFSTTQKEINSLFVFFFLKLNPWSLKLLEIMDWELTLEDWGYENQGSSHLRCNVSFEDLNLQFFFFFRKNVKGRNMFFSWISLFCLSASLHIPPFIHHMQFRRSYSCS